MRRLGRILFVVVLLQYHIFEVLVDSTLIEVTFLIFHFTVYISWLKTRITVVSLVVLLGS